MLGLDVFVAQGQNSRQYLLKLFNLLDKKLQLLIIALIINLVYSLFHLVILDFDKPNLIFDFVDIYQVKIGLHPFSLFFWKEL